jgi:predicted transcriptional regulator
MTATTIELPDDLHAQVRELAQATDRPVAEVLTEAVAHYLEWDRWFRAEVEKGRRSAEAGPLVPAQEVWADFLERGLVTPEALAEAEAEDARETA